MSAKVQRDGDTWAITWDEHGIAMGLERLWETSDGLKAEITIESDIAGRVLGPVGLNLLSTRSQSELATNAQKRGNTLPPETWHKMVVYACAIVAKQYRQPQPVLVLAKESVEGPVEYLIPGIMPKGETTILYGDGEAGKSMLALRIALSADTGMPLPWGPRIACCNVLYLDWETQPRTVATRLHRLSLGCSSAMPGVLYRQCFRSLADELGPIREEISRREIGLVIVDSIGFAATGPLTEDLPARQTINALRNMAPATRLVVAHVSKESADQARGKVKPFGSAFFWNGMRSGIEVRRGEDQLDQDAVDLGLYHRKSNDGQHERPIGLRLTFEGQTGPVRFERADIQDTPDLAVRTSLSDRLREALRLGGKDTLELVKEVDSSYEVVARTLRRMPDVMVLMPGGGRGKPATWGLTQ